MNRSLAVVLAVTIFAVGCGRAGQGPESPSPVSLIASGGSAAAGLIVPWSTFTADAGRRAGIFSGTRAQLGSGPQAVVVPGAPFMLPPTVSGTTVTLNWLPPNSGDLPTSYTIEAGSSPGGSNLANFDTGNTVTTLAVLAVPAGTYYVRVRGRNPVGLGDPSNEIVAVVAGAPCTPPGAPSALAAIVNGSTVTLTWNGAAGARTYAIEAGSSPGATNLADFDVPGTPTSFTAINVAPGTYFVRVRSDNACGTSAASNEVVVIVAVPFPVLTGRWLGAFPDGIFLPDAVCEREFDLQLDLTQSGSALTGTGTLRVRVSTGGSSCAHVGDVGSNALTGTVGTDGSIAIRFSPVPGVTADLTGTVLGNHMRGAITFRIRSETNVGTWTLNRQ